MERLEWVTACTSEPTSPSCGDWRSVFADCSRVRGHDIERIRLGCNRWECNSCGYRRACREARKAANRLEGCRTAAGKYGIDLGEVRHVIISTGDWKKESTLEPYLEKPSYVKLKRQVLDEYMAIGMIGGTHVFHAIRGKPYQIQAYQAHKIDLPFSPHHHAVGFMPEGFQIDSKAFYERTGHIYKNLPLRKSDAVYNILKYELNHHARYITPSGHMSQALTWFGCSSYNQVTVQLQRDSYIKPCRKCGSDKHKYTEDYAFDLGEYTKIKEKRSYQLEPDQLTRVLARFRIRPDARLNFTPSWTDQEQGVLPDQ